MFTVKLNEILSSSFNYKFILMITSNYHTRNGWCCWFYSLKRRRETVNIDPQIHLNLYAWIQPTRLETQKWDWTAAYSWNYSPENVYNIVVFKRNYSQCSISKHLIPRTVSNNNRRINVQFNVVRQHVLILFICCFYIHTKLV